VFRYPDVLSPSLILIQQQYRDRLDEGLILAIVGEYELNDQAAFEAAWVILDGLAQNADVEQATGFNPSGFSSYIDGADDGESAQHTASTISASEGAPSSKTSQSGRDIVGHPSVLSANMKLLSLLDNEQLHQSNASEEGLFASLRAMFPELKDLDIRDAIKNGKGEYDKACDYLLNLQQLESEGVRPKGLDAFFRPDDVVRRKGKGKGKGRSGAVAGEAAQPGISSSGNDLVSGDNYDQRKPKLQSILYLLY
jgi:hypothetical protein